MKTQSSVCYQEIATESDEFVAGELIKINSSRLKGKQTGFKPGEIYLVIATQKRWSRWKLTMGKKELEYCVSDERPNGEAWKRDFLCELHPLYSSLCGQKNLTLKSYGSQRAGAYYFTKYRISKDEVKKGIKEYFEKLSNMLDGKVTGDFVILANMLNRGTSFGTNTTLTGS